MRDATKEEQEGLQQYIDSISYSPLKELRKRFRKVCVNAFRSYNWRDGKKVNMWYRHPDLHRYAKDAFERGEDYFFANKGSNNCFILSEPEYEYRFVESLSEDEYKRIFEYWK